MPKTPCAESAFCETTQSCKQNVASKSPNTVVVPSLCFASIARCNICSAFRLRVRNKRPGFHLPRFVLCVLLTAIMAFRRRVAQKARRVLRLVHLVHRVLHHVFFYFHVSPRFEHGVDDRVDRGHLLRRRSSPRARRRQAYVSGNNQLSHESRRSRRSRREKLLPVVADVDASSVSVHAPSREDGVERDHACDLKTRPRPRQGWRCASSSPSFVVFRRRHATSRRRVRVYALQNTRAMYPMRAPSRSTRARSFVPLRVERRRLETRRAALRTRGRWEDKISKSTSHDSRSENRKHSNVLKLISNKEMMDGCGSKPARRRVPPNASKTTTCVRVLYGLCNSSCRPRVCFPGVSEDVRDVSAILTRDVVRASPTSHNVVRASPTSRGCGRGRVARRREWTRVNAPPRRCRRRSHARV